MTERAHIESRDGRAELRAEIRHVFAMSLPVVITTSSRAMMDVADYFMISVLGNSAMQAAMLPAQMILFAYIVLGLGTVSLVNTFASQSMGRGQLRACSAYAWHAVYLAIIIGIIGLVLRPYFPVIVAAMGHEPAVQAMEIAYGHIALLTICPSVAAAALGAFFIGVHRPWITTRTAIEANVVNVGVSFVLIFGHLGFESMGVVGAAWGTLVGVSYRTVRLGFAFLRADVDERFASRSTWRPRVNKMLGLLRLGLPAGVHWVSEVCVWAIFVSVLVGREFGTPHLIATNVAWQYLRIAYLPAIGVGQALTALVGKSVGAGQKELALRQTRICMFLTGSYMAVLSIVYITFRYELMSLFSSDAMVVDIGACIMLCAALFQMFDVIGVTYDGALRGVGDTFVPAMFYVVCNWILLVVIGWQVAKRFPELGSLGPWLCATAMIGLTALFLWRRWHARGWARIDIFGSRDTVDRVRDEACRVPAGVG